MRRSPRLGTDANPYRSRFSQRYSAYLPSQAWGTLGEPPGLSDKEIERVMAYRGRP